MSQLKSVVRFDSMPMPRAYFTPEGYLKDRPILTSVGIFEYSDHGNVRRELRLPEDVFSPESLNSYLGKPVVLTHDAGLIDKDNVAENQIGTILSKGERSGDDVKAEIIIHDTDAMKSAGLKELSLGYNLDLDETPGVWNGQRYDAVQKNIRINHLALVREARAGEQARLNLDGRAEKTILTGGKNMTKKTKKRTSHADAVLSDEEFQKAVEEYKKNRAAKADAEDEEKVVAEEQAPEGAFGDVEKKVAEVKERRDRRDEQGDPKDTDEAMGIIAHQDEDLDTLFDLIDTLLAKLNFDAAGEEEEEKAPEEEAPAPEEDEFEEDEVDELNELKGNEDADDEEIPEEESEEEEEEFVEDEDDEEEVPEDDEEDDEFAEDEDDENEFEDEEEEENEDGVLGSMAAGAVGGALQGALGKKKKENEDAEDEEQDFEDEDDEDDDDFNTDACGRRVNMDAVDRLVSQKLRMDKLGEQVGIHGLGHKSVGYAKKAIIKKVRPGIRLDGKSDAYINACFDMAKTEIKKQAKKDTSYQKRQMFNKPNARMDSANAGSDASRRNMVKRQMNHK